MMLVTIRPGPTVMVWRDGGIFAEIELEPGAALEIASKLLKEASLAMRHKAADSVPDGTQAKPLAND